MVCDQQQPVCAHIHAQQSGVDAVVAAQVDLVAHLLAHPSGERGLVWRARLTRHVNDRYGHIGFAPQDLLPLALSGLLDGATECGVTVNDRLDRTAQHLHVDRTFEKEGGDFVHFPEEASRRKERVERDEELLLWGDRVSPDRLLLLLSRGHCPPQLTRRAARDVLRRVNR